MIWDSRISVEGLSTNSGVAVKLKLLDFAPLILTRGLRRINCMVGLVSQSPSLIVQ